MDTQNSRGQIVRPERIITQGSKFSSRVVNFTDRRVSKSKSFVELDKLMRGVFLVKNLVEYKSCIIWHDEMDGLGSNENTYTKWPGVYILGVLFSEDERREAMTHIFVRNMQGFTGPLDEWCADIQYPVGVRRYSVIVILPTGFEMPLAGRRDPHNYPVATLRIEDMLATGYNFEPVRQWVLSDA